MDVEHFIFFTIFADRNEDTPMNREEAIAKGMEVQETKHSMKRRSPWHDYSRKGTYMLTLVVDGRAPLLGVLKGSVDASREPYDVPRVELSELGSTIRREETGKISRFYPWVEVWKVCIMPDHIHMIIRVKEDMPRGKHLGQVVRGFKTGCSRAWWRMSKGAPSGKTEGTGATGGTGAAGGTGTAGGAGATGATGGTETAEAAGRRVITVPSASPDGLLPVLFERGYNDKILLHEGQFDNWKAYLDDNPRRLLIKRQNPQLFTVLHGMNVANHECQVVGNRFLLDIPDKMAVIVHRRYTDEENARLRKEWLACGERGGVLVSAAISPKEKEVMREAMNCGYRIILLRENGFPKLYKPTGESFDACHEGLLLQISPWDYHMERKTITRTQCMELNAMAERIAGNRS